MGNPSKKNGNVSRPPILLCVFAFLCFFIVFVGSRAGANKQSWINAFFVIFALGVVVMTTQTVRTGSFGGLHSPYIDRVRSPIQFWIAVVISYAIALAFLIMPFLKKA